MKNVIDGKQPCLLLKDIDFFDWTNSTYFTTNRFAIELHDKPDILAYLPRKAAVDNSEEVSINSIDNEIWSSQKSFIATIYR